MYIVYTLNYNYNMSGIWYTSNEEEAKDLVKKINDKMKEIKNFNCIFCDYSEIESCKEADIDKIIY